MKLKIFGVAVVAAILGFGAAVVVLNHPSGTRSSLPPAAGATAGEAASVPEHVTTKAVTASRVATQAPTAAEEIAASNAKRTLQDLLNELAAIQVAPGPGQARAQYRILSLLDQLAQNGASALPALREFFTSNRDVAYANAGRNNGRGGAGNTMLPPSLRMGLFDVVRQIGSAEGEQVLSEALTATGRSVELAYLSQLLEEMSPGKYREATLTVARSLLAGGRITDASERNQLYDLLVQAKDASLVSPAQAGLIQVDGKVDGSALRYLQQTLGEKSVALAAQTFQDKRVVDADSREALGRLALNFVGANDQALELFHQAALDPQLKPDQRRNLVEDLNQDGLNNRRNPTPEDLKVIANRYALTQTYLQQDYVKNDKTLNAAFQEANKDLAKMLERAGAAPPVKTP